MKYKLRMTPDQVIQNAVNAVKHLRSMGCADIEFSPEDAGERAARRGGWADLGSKQWAGRAWHSSGREGGRRRRRRHCVSDDKSSHTCPRPPLPHPTSLLPGRSDPAFLYEILAEVIKAGATTLNIPDTTGWTLPHEFQVGLGWGY